MPRGLLLFWSVGRDEHGPRGLLFFRLITPLKCGHAVAMAVNRDGATRCIACDLKYTGAGLDK